MGLRRFRLEASIIVLFALAIAAVAAFDIDLSPRRDLRNDLLFRAGARSEGPLTHYRFVDPSPYALYLPSLAYLHRTIPNGELPLWDRLQAGGYSPAAEFGCGVFFPLRWMISFFEPSLGASILILLSLAFALLGVLSFLRVALDLPAAPALLGGLVAATSGYPISLLLFDAFAWPVFYIPWILTAYFAWLKEPTALRFSGLVLVLFTFYTSGHPAFLTASVITVAMTALVHALRSRQMLKGPLGLAAGGVLGAALAGHALGPFFVSLTRAWSYKTATAEGVSYNTLRLEWWLEALKAMVLRPPEYYSLDSYLFFAHLGLIPVALIAAGMVAAKSRPELRFLWLLLPFGFAIGWPGPWMAFLRAIPPFKYCRPWYLLGPFWFATSCASAAGLAWLLTKLPQRVAPVAGVAAIAAVLLNNLPRLEEQLGPARARPLPPSSALDFLRADPEPFRVTGLWGQVHLGNATSLTGIEDLRTQAGFLNPRLAAWLLLVDPGIMKKNFPSVIMTDRVNNPLLGAFNVKYVLNGRADWAHLHSRIVHALHPWDPAIGIVGVRDLDDFRPALAVDLPAVHGDQELTVHRSARVSPRAFLAGRVAAVPDQPSAERWLSDHLEAVTSTAVVEGLPPERAAALRGRGTAAVRYPRDAEVIIETESSEAALLVLNDAYDPGWSATIDGVRTDILPVNLVARGVVLPAGKHQVRMTFVPDGLIPGAIAGLLVLAVGAAQLGRFLSTYRYQRR